MSVNIKENGELVTVASGQRIWIGTKNAWAALNDKPTNCLKAIIDDGGGDNTLTETVKSTTYLTGGTFYLKKYGNVIHFNFLETGNAHSLPDIGSWTTIGTIPEGYRPMNTIYLNNQGSGYDNLKLQIYPSGNILIYKMNNDVGWEISFNTCYIID